MKNKLIIAISLTLLLILSIVIYYYIDNTKIIGTVDEQAKALAIKEVNENNISSPIFACSLKNVGDDIILTLYSSEAPFKQSTIYHFNDGVVTSVEIKRYFSSKLEANNNAKVNLELSNVSIKDNIVTGNISYQGDMGKTKKEIQENLEKYCAITAVLINY